MNLLVEQPFLKRAEVALAFVAGLAVFAATSVAVIALNSTVLILLLIALCVATVLATFRYLGPKPQFREAALVMIADAVEAASRSMPEPTRERLQALVQRIINAVFTEGQLDECDLTLRDLNAIATSFLHTLEGIYHARPVYPPGALGPRAGAPGPVPMPVGAPQTPAAVLAAAAAVEAPVPKKSAGT